MCTIKKDPNKCKRECASRELERGRNLFPQNYSSLRFFPSNILTKVKGSDTLKEKSDVKAT